MALLIICASIKLVILDKFPVDFLILWIRGDELAIFLARFLELH
jgi:hypothetical protein